MNKKRGKELLRPIADPLEGILRAVGKMRGPFEDIEFEDDFLLKMFEAGEKIGSALRDVPFPPIQITGSLIDTGSGLSKNIHRTVLDFVQINEALYESSPEVSGFKETMKGLESIGLGKEGSEEHAERT